MKYHDKNQISMLRDYNICKGNTIDSYFIKNLNYQLQYNNGFHIYDLFVIPRDAVQLIEFECISECFIRVEIESMLHKIDLELIDDYNDKLITSSRHGSYNPELFVGLGKGK